MSAKNSLDPLANVNFTGGIPTQEDFVPSIVFLIAYLLLVPVALWCFISPDSRCMILIRPTIFVGVRIAFAVLRILLVKQGLSEGVLIAQLILVLCGTVLLIEPLVTMLTNHVKDHISSRDEKKRSWTSRILSILRIFLIVAIVLGITAGSSISGAIEDPSKMASIKSQRTASYALSLAVVGVTIVMALISQARYPLEIRKTGYLLVCGCLLLVITIYRLVSSETTDASAWVRSKTAFWVLDIKIELLVTIAYFCIPIPEWFPAAGPLEQAETHDDQPQMMRSSKYDEV